MTQSEIIHTVEKIFVSIEKQIPKYMANPEDRSISEGNVAVCIIDEEGQIYGRMYGEDKIKQRYFYQIAWSKASQVWITQKKTGEFEKLVFTGELNDKPFGIKRSDFIGWEGGQPIKLKGMTLSIGFSGFRAVNDLEIVTNAVNEVLMG